MVLRSYDSLMLRFLLGKVGLGWDKLGEWQRFVTRYLRYNKYLEVAFETNKGAIYSGISFHAIHIKVQLLHAVTCAD